MPRPVSSPRALYLTLRRTYRIACRLPSSRGSVDDGQRCVNARVSACAALRVFTNRWDTMEPTRRNLWAEGHAVYHRPTGTYVWRAYVSPAAKRFFREVSA